MTRTEAVKGALMRPQYTQGPWSDAGASHKLYRLIMNTKTGMNVGLALPHNVPIITAAPEMLEALKSMVAVLENVHSEHPEELWLGSEYQLAKQVIARADR